MGGGWPWPGSSSRATTAGHSTSSGSWRTVYCLALVIHHPDIGSRNHSQATKAPTKAPTAKRQCAEFCAPSNLIRWSRSSWEELGDLGKLGAAGQALPTGGPRPELQVKEQTTTLIWSRTLHPIIPECEAPDSHCCPEVCLAPPPLVCASGLRLLCLLPTESSNCRHGIPIQGPAPDTG